MQGSFVAFKKTDGWQWFNSESIFLPEGSEKPLQAVNGNDEQDAPSYHLPKLNAALRLAIVQLSGRVFPKLNWTSPRVCLAS